MDACPIKMVAALISDAAGPVLLLRKRGTSAFMQPGAPGREIDETVRVDPASPPEMVLAPFTRDHVLPLARTGMHMLSARSAEKLHQHT